MARGCVPTPLGWTAIVAVKATGYTAPGGVLRAERAAPWKPWTGTAMKLAWAVPTTGTLLSAVTFAGVLSPGFVRGKHGAISACIAFALGRFIPWRRTTARLAGPSAARAYVACFAVVGGRGPRSSWT